MFRGLEWNPDAVYPEEPKNFNVPKPEKTKKMAVEAYNCFLKMVGGQWQPPKIHESRKIPLHSNR